MKNICPLCEKTNNSIYYIDELKRNAQKKTVEYYQCNQCDLIYQNPETLLDHNEEKSRYLEHNNTLSDERYLQYLTASWNFAMGEIHQDIKNVLDYGCGPVEGIKKIAGNTFDVLSYDPFFYAETQLHKESFDLIFCIEAIEHFKCPKKELDKIKLLLKKNSYFMIRTGIVKESIVFKDWYYHRDPTHICFYSVKTIEWLARGYNYKIIKIKGDFVLLQGR